MTALWLPITLSLIAHLKSIPELENAYNIGAVGLPDDPDKESRIEVEWDAESELAEKPHTQGQLVLYVDIACRTDSTDPVDGWRLQYEAQQQILQSLEQWQQKLERELKIGTIISVPGVASYGQETRPVYANRLVLLVKWRGRGR